jgi:DNA-binding transcriptional ArsR family regulator
MKKDRQCCPNSECKFHTVTLFIETLKALHCPTRWKILSIIGETEKTTGEIFQKLSKEEVIVKSSFYYHLSCLEKANIIEQVGYKEEGGGAPEKIWRLRMKEIKIDLVNDNPFK